MRCYVAGVQHESGSFSPIPTSFRSFVQVRWGVDGPQRSHVMGYGEACDLAEAAGMQVIAGPFFNAEPAMPATAPAWRAIRDRILDELRAAAPVDVVFLCLHGAQMADGVDDCEGELLTLVREIVGERAAVGALLDLHANVSSTMLDAADLVVSCREYPHIDYGERAAEMLPVLQRIARGEAQPTTAAIRFAAPGVYPTTEEPTRSFVARFTAAQQRPGVLMVSANHGFEGSDQHDTGCSIVVTTDDDLALAESLAHELADDFLTMIRSQEWTAKGVTEALDEALAPQPGPVVMSDSSDNAGGGAASDSTFVLRELLARDAQDVALALLWDPVAVKLCHAAGVGGRIPLRVGGKAGPMSGDPLDVFAEITCVRDDAMQALFGKGEPNYRMGKSAAIRIGGVQVVLNSSRQQVFSTHCFSEHDIDPLRTQVLVVKSTQHFMNGFGPIAAKVVRCEGPGTMSPDLRVFPYRKVRRPLAGLDAAELVQLEAMPVASRRR